MARNLQEMLPALFVGDGGAFMTQEQINEKRAIADALMKQGDPAFEDAGVLGVLGRGLEGYMIGRDRRAANRAEAENREYDSGLLASLLSGGSSMPSMGAGGAQTAGTVPVDSAPLDYASSRVAQAHGSQPVGGNPYRDAIASIESAGSGDYNAIGPTNSKLGRALGRYQIMEANIAPWSREALGREITADEFMANPELQDAIFDHKFNTYVDQFGPEGAAQAWFAGPGGVGKLNRKDVLGTDVGSYGQKFMKALGPQSAQQPQQSVQVAQSGGINPELLQVLSDPRVSDQTRGVAQLLLQQQMQQNDPMRQLQMQKAQLELEQMRNPQGESFTLSPGQMRFDAQGNVVAQGGASNDAPTVQKLKLNDGSEVAVQWDGSSQQWIPIKAPQGGGLADPKQKLTESQSKLTLFQSLQNETQPVLLDLEKTFNPGNLPDHFAGNVLGGNFLKSEQGQMYDSAATAWSEGALRIATGAAATPEEMQRTKKAYFAQPGDTPQTIAFKAQMRDMYDRAIQRSLGSTEIEGALPKPSDFAKQIENQGRGDGWTQAPNGVRIRKRSQ